MASSSSFLSEEMFQCSICLDVFVDPVTIPCGHNFCMACVLEHWDSTNLCQCPMCQKSFGVRPDLSVNTFISEMAAQVIKTAEDKDTASQTEDLLVNDRVEDVSDSIEQALSKPGEVPCDICTGRKLKAHKSCLVCLASYCKSHWESHQLMDPFKKHTVIYPVENLHERVCKKHEKPLSLFCRDDKTFLCLFCTESDHKTHKTVPIEEESRLRKATFGETKDKAKRMIENHLRNIEAIKGSVEIQKKDAKTKIAESMQVFADLLQSIAQRQAEVIEDIEKRQEATEKEAERLIEEIEKEITKLQISTADIDELADTEDHFYLLQNSPSVCVRPPTTSLFNIRVGKTWCPKTLRDALSQLENQLNKEITKLCHNELIKLQESAVDVTLDPDSANESLILSADCKSVRCGKKTYVLFGNSHFETASVMGREGICSGRMYFEVMVKGRTRWVVGMVKETFVKKKNVKRSPARGIWSVGLWDGFEYKAYSTRNVNLSLRNLPRKVGVFVDYEEGVVSFYDVEAQYHIYSFTKCNFTERIYPYLHTGHDKSGLNSSPLIICPVENPCDFLTFS